MAGFSHAKPAGRAYPWATDNPKDTRRRKSLLGKAKEEVVEEAVDTAFDILD